MISASSRVRLPTGLFEVVGDPEDYSTGPFPFPLIGPATREVVVEEWTATGEDAHGNETGTWTASSLKVYGWSPPTAPKTIGAEETLVELELLVPPVYVVNLRRPGPR